MAQRCEPALQVLALEDTARQLNTYLTGQHRKTLRLLCRRTFVSWGSKGRPHCISLSRDPLTVAQLPWSQLLFRSVQLPPWSFKRPGSRRRPQIERLASRPYCRPIELVVAPLERMIQLAGDWDERTDEERRRAKVLGWLLHALVTQPGLPPLCRLAFPLGQGCTRAWVLREALEGLPRRLELYGFAPASPVQRTYEIPEAYWSLMEQAGEPRLRLSLRSDLWRCPPQNWITHLALEMELQQLTLPGLVAPSLVHLHLTLDCHRAHYGPGWAQDTVVDTFVRALAFFVFRRHRGSPPTVTLAPAAAFPRHRPDTPEHLAEWAVQADTQLFRRCADAWMNAEGQGPQGPHACRPLLTHTFFPDSTAESLAALGDDDRERLGARFSLSEGDGW
jgi:hypothetical protein